ncbi:recombinase family protein, partial [Bacillaceae bacterium Marseille-Q3522]|nr:recombinase family protein [Bacillaceae bacterium Marseille-Q3522]
MLFNSNEKKLITYNEYPYLIYGRVSSDKDEQVSSIENQIDICRNWIEKNNFEWNDKAVVKDDGISGTEFLKRSAMQLILRKARHRDIKMVIFKSIHRLARDMRDALEIKDTLIAHGVRLVTIEEGFDSLYEGKNDMKFEMFSMFAAQYPKTLSVSISAALSAKLRRGEHIGPIPFGYTTENKKLIINEKEAPTVRQIFRWYNEDGFGFKTITKLLNEQLAKGNVYKPRRKDIWQVTTVQRIIQNVVYVGVFVHNRYAKIKVNGRKKQIKNPREKWIIYENHHPAIISMQEWEKANSKDVPNKKTKITPWNDFRGLLKCSECGSNMIILQSYKKKKDGSRTEWKYLKCSAYRRAGKYACVNHTPI